jgi:hypothetical protein
VRYGWIILLVSLILGLLVALLLVLSPNTVLVEDAFRAGAVPGALRAWGVTWLFFNIIALVVLFRGLRQGGGGRGERCGCCRCCGCRTLCSTPPPSTTS